jgi:dTMP kinase
LLDLPAEEGLQRRQQGGNWNRLDAYALEFHKRVRQGYAQLAAEEPQRWVTIDASQNPENVLEEIIAVVEARLRDD